MMEVEITQSLSDNIPQYEGDINQIIYVDRYTHNSNYRKRLNNFSKAIKELIPGTLFDIVTAHTPYTQHHEIKN